MTARSLNLVEPVGSGAGASDMQSGASIAPIARGAGPVVLCLDDEPLIVRALARDLSRADYTVYGALSSDEAWKVLSDVPVDIIVSDQVMPGGMSGVEFLTEVRDRYPETIRIVFTGHSTLDVAVRAINDGGICQFIQKPGVDGQLRLTIREALKQRDNARLRAAAEQQRRDLHRLEHRYPGITRVRRTTSGAIVIDDAEMLNGLPK